MRDKLRWLAVPPALALLLMFGPWRKPAPAASRPAVPLAESVQDSVKPAPAVPAPDLTQVVCTVAGICLFGGAIVVGLARVQRRRAAGGAGGPIALRQSMRLSAKHAVHAVQFDDRILLLGESDGALVVRHTAADPDAEARARTAAHDPDDDGAVLKGMVLPRPPRGATAPSKPALASFRTLLAKTQADA